MAIREKAKNFFRRGSRNSLSKTSTNESSRERYPSNVYAPGEPMPPPKYRRPPQKEHKEKLEAFSFSDAWRKKSFQSAYSPMGTRLNSRRNSALSIGHSRKSLKSRTNSVSSSSGKTEDMESSSRQATVTTAAVPPRLTVQSEQEGDDTDVTNGGSSSPAEATDKDLEKKVDSRLSVELTGDAAVGLSRPRTAEDKRPRTAEDKHDSANGLHKTMSTAHDHQPFSEQDLALALQRSNVPVSAEA